MRWFYPVAAVGFAFQAVVMWMLFQETGRGMFLAGLLIALVLTIGYAVASVRQLRRRSQTPQ